MRSLFDNLTNNSRTHSECEYQLVLRALKINIMRWSYFTNYCYELNFLSLRYRLLSDSVWDYFPPFSRRCNTARYTKSLSKNSMLNLFSSPYVKTVLRISSAIVTQLKRLLFNYSYQSSLTIHIKVQRMHGRTYFKTAEKATNPPNYTSSKSLQEKPASSH